MGGDESTESGNTGEPAIDTYQYKSVKFTTSLEDLTNTSHYIELFLLSRNNSNTDKSTLPSDDIKLDFSWKDQYGNIYELYVKNNNYIKFSGISFKIDGGDLDIK